MDIEAVPIVDCRNHQPILTMKHPSSFSNLSRWAAFSAAALGTVTLLVATPQMDPEGVTEVSEFLQMEIYHDTMMEGSEVTVGIEERIAILTGTVTSLAQAERAATKALTSPDVLTVVNQIKIVPQEGPEILSHARSLLASQEVIDNSRISVSTIGSHLILEGNVGSLDEGELAREIVSEAPGATAVENRLVVDFQSNRSDKQITNQLQYTVNDDPLFTGLDIVPEVKDGIVAWNGEVGSRGEFDRLIRRSYVTGVFEVDVSGVSVNGDLAMEAVEDKNYSPSQSIEALTAAINHDSRLKGEKISAEMNAGIITLTGSVETTAQSDAAELTARCIPGVLGVSNQLSIAGADEVAANPKEFSVASPRLLTQPGR